MPPYILTSIPQLVTTGRQSSHHYYKNGKTITMGNENQVNQEGGTGTRWSRTGYRNGKLNTPKNRSLRATSPILKTPYSPKGVHLTPQNMRTPSKLSPTTPYKNNPQASTSENKSEKGKCRTWHSESNPRRTTINQTPSLIWRRLSGSRKRRLSSWGDATQRKGARSYTCYLLNNASHSSRPNWKN